MPLLADLKAKAEAQLLFYEAPPLGKDPVRKMFLDLAALRPDGLTSIQWSGIDLLEFAKVIEANRSELRPWITVYAAAFGLMGPWVTVQNIWCRSGVPPAGQNFTPAVQEALDSLFSGYVTLIAT
jgi:hypothetical protein